VPCPVVIVNCELNSHVVHGTGHSRRAFRGARITTPIYTLKSLDLGSAPVYGRGMEQTVSMDSLRRQAGACLARVSRGDSIVVLRHGHPVAILRPPQGRELNNRGAANALRRNLRDLITAAHREPVLITWYGDEMAVLERLPGSNWEAES
jgi:antitoxin (DNA-binding transcriptional repressor) of toxin-antitoxin stability system